MKEEITKDPYNTDSNKARVLNALEKNLGIITKACKMAHVSRTTFYEWMKDDEAFKLSVNDLSEVALDFAESKLLEQIDANIPSSTIFYLKTKGRKRGYVERIDIADVTEQPLFSFDDAPLLEENEKK